jgi:hypothetical protein
MDTDVPYLMSVTNLHKILDQMQKAGVPENFNRDFLKDLGFGASGDRPMVKLLKYLGFLDSAGRPTSTYRDFMDHTKAKKILGVRIPVAFDDLYLSDRQAQSKPVEALKGWFKSKTGSGDAVAQKMASTFKSLSSYADFTGIQTIAPEEVKPPPAAAKEIDKPPPPTKRNIATGETSIGFVYRIEIHLPDTQNIETFRAIFKALREELL